MRVWRWLLAALAWLVAVVVVASVAWFAIDSAGREVGAAGPVTVVQPAGNVLPASSDGPSATRSPSPAPSATAREVPASGSPSVPPSATPSGSPSGAPPRSPSGGPSPVPSRPGGATNSPAPSAPSLPSGTGSGRNGTYSSVAGDLTVRCAGASVEAWGVRPADGWRVDPAPGTRGALVVVFRSDDGRVIEVGVTCRDGVPVFRSTTSPG